MGVREADIRADEDEDDRGRSSARRARLEEGMKVKANYRGKGQYFGGKIKRDNRDGTYDIAYDDGDREMGVREADIRADEDEDDRGRSSARRKRIFVQTRMKTTA